MATQGAWTDPSQSQPATTAPTVSALTQTPVLLLIDLAAAIAFVLIPDFRTAFQDNSDPSSLEVVPSVDSFVQTLQLALQILIAFISAVCTYIGARVLIESHERHTGSLIGILVLKALCCFMDIINLQAGDTYRTVFVFCQLAFRVFEGVVCTVLIFWKRQDLMLAPFQTVLPDDDHELMQAAEAQTTLKKLDKWLDLRETRQALNRSYRSQNRLFLIACFIFVLLVVGNAVSEFATILTSQSSFLSSANLARLNTLSNIQASFGTVRTQSDKRVVLTVLDGFRYDYLFNNPTMHSFVYNDSFIRDAKVYKMRAQIPSMSVPNWLTILTGARPELHGTMGNLLVPETKFDSIFNQARIWNVNRGLTASPWFADIIRSNLPYLRGDGTIDTSAVPAGEASVSGSSDPADTLRGQVAMSALQDTNYPYDLFLTHFSDIDAQGHDKGVLPRWNKVNSYNGAIVNKTAILQQMLTLMDNRTVWIITSDHGHVDRGGHGGVDDALLNVPLLIYQKGSNFNTSVMNWFPRFNKDVENTDLSATICAILGLPVPRQSQGVFIDDVMMFANNASLSTHYRDLYIQKQQLFATMLVQTGSSYSTTDPYIITDVTTTAVSNEFYVRGVLALQDAMDSLKSQLYSIYLVRNILLTVVVLGIALFILVIIMHLATFVDWTAALSFVAINAGDVFCTSHLYAILFGFFAVVLYYGLTAAIYYGLEYGNGYTIWDSTVIHTPKVVPFYVASALIPGIILEYLLARFIVIQGYAPFEVKQGDSESVLRYRARYVLQLAGRFLFGYRSHYVDYGRVYLIKCFTMFWTITISLLILFFQTPYTFSLPVVFRILFVNPTNWVLRFRVITVQITSIPLIIGSFALVMMHPSDHTSTSTFDSVYLLKVKKDARYRDRQQTRVSDVESNKPTPTPATVTVEKLQTEIALESLSAPTTPPSSVDGIEINKLGASVQERRPKSYEDILHTQYTQDFEKVDNPRDFLKVSEKKSD